MSKENNKCKPFAWGYNNYYQLGYPTFRSTFVNVCSIDDVIQVDGGEAHSLALRSDGNVFAWGSNEFGQLGDGTTTDRNAPTKVQGIDNISFISAGNNHSLAVNSYGTVFAWGRNNDGQLGNGTTDDSNVPVQVTHVAGFTDIVAVAGGNDHSLALKSNGDVFAWGDNDAGQLGIGSFSDREETPQKTQIDNVIAIAAGTDFSLALKSDGRVFAWGTNSSGQLGIGGIAGGASNVPVQVNTINNIIAIASGDAHSLALECDGTLWSWGSNSNGQLGDGTRVNQRTSPVQVLDIKDIKLMEQGSIAAGGDHSMALLNDGTVKTWGQNDFGQLGDGIQIDSNLPVDVIGLKCAKFVGAGSRHSLAIRIDGTVWSWGDNFVGQLGNGEFGGVSSIPVKVKGLEGITDIACGEFHNLALKSDKKIRGWGSNVSGQLGDGTFGGGRDIPVLVKSIDSVKAIAAGESFSIALRDDGNVFAWGENSLGQLGDGTTIDRTFPKEVIGLPEIIKIAAGGGFSLALDCKGRVWSWGDNDFGQLGDGTTVNKLVPVMVEDLDDVVEIECGDSHSLAIKSDGTVFTWGRNDSGELGIGFFGGNSTVPVQVNLLNVKAVSGGGEHSLALTCDGKIFAWGDNSSGQLGNGTIINSNVPTQVLLSEEAVAIAAGGFHSLALVKNCSNVFAWGDNTFGQLGDGSIEDSSIPTMVIRIRDVIQICAGQVHSLAISCKSCFSYDKDY